MSCDSNGLSSCDTSCLSVLVLTVVLRSCLVPAVAAVAAATAAACCYCCCCVVVTLLAGTDIFTENAKKPR